jgi:hypothetical protein
MVGYTSYPSAFELDAGITNSQRLLLSRWSGPLPFISSKFKPWLWHGHHIVSSRMTVLTDLHKAIPHFTETFFLPGGPRRIGAGLGPWW